MKVIASYRNELKNYEMETYGGNENIALFGRTCLQSCVGYALYRGGEEVPNCGAPVAALPLEGGDAHAAARRFIRCVRRGQLLLAWYRPPYKGVLIVCEIMQRGPSKHRK